MNRLVVAVLLLAVPAFCDTLYTVSGGTAYQGGSTIYPGEVESFTYDVTTGRFLDASSADVPGVKLPDWPFPIWGISFDPVIADAQPSTFMTLGMSDGDGEPIEIGYSIIGFTGDFGTYISSSSNSFGCASYDPPYCDGAYGLPGILTLTASDPPADAPEPANLAFVGALALLGSGVARRLRRSRQRT